MGPGRQGRRLVSDRRHREGQRTFRVDRIAEAEITDEPAERPADFDLSESGSGWSTRSSSGASVTATVLIAPRRVHVLQNLCGRHCEHLGEHEDGRARVRVSSPNASV